MTSNADRTTDSEALKHWFEGETVDEVYAKLRTRFEGVLESVDHVATRVIRPRTSFPAGAATVTQEEVEKTVEHLTRDLSDVDFWFNHRTRIARYGANRINQFSLLSETLAAPSQEVYGTFAIMDPEADFGAQKSFETPPPFFSLGQFSKTRDEILSITGVYRRQEMSSWWIVNIWELIRYRDEMVSILKEKFDMDVISGWVSTIAISAHWRTDYKPMVAIPAFDQPSQQGELGSLLAQVFEEGGTAATSQLVELLNQKMSQLSARNAPSLGVSNLLKLLRLVEIRYRARNANLYESIKDQLEEIKQLHEDLRKGEEAEMTAMNLKGAYNRLAEIFGASG